MVVFFLTALDQTIVATAMPRIVEQLRGLEYYAWVTTAYMLTSTVMVPIYGKLSDLYGRRRILLVGIVIFLIGSVLCGLSGEFGPLPIIGDGMTQLITARAIQGLGGAALFSAAFTVIADLYPPRERAKFAGLFGAMFGLASALGPLIGGFFTDLGTTQFLGREFAGWRWSFFVNVPLGLASLFLIAFKMPFIAPKAVGRIDFFGAAFFILALVPFLLALTWAGQEYPWRSPEILSLFVVAFTALVVFIAIQKKVKDPILPLDLFRNRVFSTCNSTGFLTGMAFLGVVMFLPLFMQLVLGVDATQSGIALMPLLFGMIISAAICGVLVTRTGNYKSYLMGGMVLLVLSMFLLSDIGAQSSSIDVSWRVFLMGIALGPSQSIFNIAIQNAVPAAVLGVATSASQFFRQIGSLIGVAIFGTLLTHHLNLNLPNHVPHVPGAQVDRFDLSEAQALAMNPDHIQEEVEVALRARYDLVARAYGGDGLAAANVISDPAFSDEIKAPLLEEPFQSNELLDRLPALRQSILAPLQDLVAATEEGLKLAFSNSIAELFKVGLWIMFIAFGVAVLIPALPFREVQLEESAGDSR